MTNTTGDYLTFWQMSFKHSPWCKITHPCTLNKLHNYMCGEGTPNGQTVLVAHHHGANMLNVGITIAEYDESCGEHRQSALWWRNNQLCCLMGMMRDGNL
jgi:hypothetical protein